MKTRKRLLLHFVLVVSFVSCGNKNQNEIPASMDGMNISQEETGTKPVGQDGVCEQEAVEIIRKFYESYLSDSPALSKDSLNKAYLTKNLIEKLDRLVYATDINPIIRAQDTDENALESLSVERLESNWYRVNFLSGKGTPFESKKNIPLRVVRIAGKSMIDYITPIWNDGLYGDSLVCDHPQAVTIDTSKPTALLKSFYDAYTMQYCSMPEQLTQQLAILRNAHLTTNALNQFDSAEKEFRQDGRKGYDLLIDDFDFDCLWRSSIQITPMDGDIYQISYEKNEMPRTLIVNMVKREKRYYIDSISKE